MVASLSHLNYQIISPVNNVKRKSDKYRFCFIETKRCSFSLGKGHIFLKSSVFPPHKYHKSPGSKRPYFQNGCTWSSQSPSSSESCFKQDNRRRLGRVYEQGWATETGHQKTPPATDDPGFFPLEFSSVTVTDF